MSFFLPDNRLYTSRKKSDSLSILRNEASVLQKKELAVQFLSSEQTKTTMKYSKEGSRVFVPSQPAITCSKLTIETLEQGVKYIQS